MASIPSVVSEVAAALLTPNQAADFLGVPSETLATWRHRRVGPPYVQLGERTPRYRTSDLVAYVAAQTVATVDPLKRRHDELEAHAAAIAAPPTDETKAR